MNRLVILGAGTAGTMAANRLRRHLPRDWSVTLVDRDDMHLYQPGLLLLPFGVYEPHDLLRPRDRFLRDGVELVLAEVERVDADTSHVRLRDGRSLGYDLLVIATGTSPRPDQTPGMTGAAWRRSIFDFFTLDGALALRDALARWPGGRLVVHVTEMPIKCPVAPLEFSFLADAYFAERGTRSSVDLTYVTPLEGAFTKPVASQHLGAMLAEREIAVEPDFVVDHVDPDSRLLVSVDDREIPFDLLVTVPLNMGDELVARSGLGDELNYVPVDRYTLQSRAHADVFAIGDANDIPASKAGSVAHFSMDGFVANVVDHVHGRPMTHRFDGHANCFVESGHGKGLLIDFNYDTEPLPGVYPYPRVGPLSLLKETRANHLGKLAFRHLYWNVLLPGRSMPVPSLMSMAGKETAGAPGR
ncbi:NAD(P)/FAD-dependent oxidoreductase [Cellulosimicrobium cellulans]|uniref:type III sulfide quinone reductase, selenoprotein subtype n=1 Tax=Cellulosimicrobium cellulans TaxID=1710 RepID=UPI001EDA0AC8|nr:FAD/NAD(P)-binding oxidoreductase [Cellulosimicrobium cellulans]UKJ64948.1 NAD(P)/FAD-dependent oxidoreductase [Cellulosimicrobium cellulans]